jgi:putative transposase
MAKKRFSAEQIVVLLRQIELAMGQGKATPLACREAGISEQSFYRWRKEYGGLQVEQAKRMKDLEKENTRLKRLVAYPARDARSEMTSSRSLPPLAVGATPPALPARGEFGV